MKAVFKACSRKEGTESAMKRCGIYVAYPPIVDTPDEQGLDTVSSGTGESRIPYDASRGHPAAAWTRSFATALCARVRSAVAAVLTNTESPKLQD